jgi:hypothetical protein
LPKLKKKQESFNPPPSASFPRKPIASSDTKKRRAAGRGRAEPNYSFTVYSPEL